LDFALVAAEIGTGSGIEDTWLGRITAQWQWQKLCRRMGDFEFQTCWQTSGGMWRGDRDILDISLTPILRLQTTRRVFGVCPYFEGAIGFHYITATQMRRRVLSTNFQFGDHLGIGFRFGTAGCLDLCYQFQHHSNASIKRPNAGINFHILRLGFRL
jgi:hypothetical protein